MSGRQLQAALDWFDSLDLDKGFEVRAAGAGWRAAFRNRKTGEIIKMPAFHDVTLLPGANGEWDESVYELWEDGFVDTKGKFYTRQQAWDAIEVMDSMLLPHNWHRQDELAKELEKKRAMKPKRKK